MKGDRERCLAAGMDAYLSKPLQVDEALAVIEQVVNGAPAVQGNGIHTQTRAATAQGTGNEVGEPPEGVFDRTAALARMQGDQELVHEIVGLFFTETPAWLSAIRESIARGDGKALEHAAHSLKGVVSTFGAHAAREAALRLERVGRDGDLTHADSACAALEKELSRLTRALTVFRGEQVP
jgi:two-component system sensor histidine kinase/response regulator